MAVYEHSRLTVLKNLTKLLQTIGDETDDPQYKCEITVVRGRAVFGANDRPPMLSILASPGQDFGRFAGDNEARMDSWVILIQGWAEDDAEHPTDPLWPLLDAVEDRLQRITLVYNETGKPYYPEAYRLGGTIASCQVLAAVVRPPVTQDAQVARACFLLPIRIDLAGLQG